MKLRGMEFQIMKSAALHAASLTLGRESRSAFALDSGEGDLQPDELLSQVDRQA